MGDCNMDHMLDASHRGHVRRHVLLDLVETGRNTGDDRNMTQEPGAQENCDSTPYYMHQSLSIPPSSSEASTVSSLQVRLIMSTFLMVLTGGRLESKSDSKS
jgi:hypothetical protein